MSIDAIKAGIGHIPTLDQITKSKEINTKDGQVSFSEMFANTVKEVNSMQSVADKQIESLTTGKGNVTPHEAMLSLEKADIAFQLMSQVRSKIIRAYEEIIRTQV